eukprot:m.1438422 g.1438422  ORF g.1438422 m.1438422 type:complete len:91 (+) comp25091_c0_seq8:1062-1334(+)
MHLSSLAIVVGAVGAVWMLWVQDDYGVAQVSFNGVLNKIGLGPYHWVLLFMCGLVRAREKGCRHVCRVLVGLLAKLFHECTCGASAMGLS